MSESLSLWKICEEKNLNYKVVIGRVLGGWSTEKALNTSCNPPLELSIEGIVVDLEHLCSVKKLNYQTVLRLIYSDNYSLKVALILAQEKKDEVKESYQTITKEKEGLAGECAKRGLNYSTVYQRLKTGWTMEEALATPINSHKKYSINGKEVKLKEYCLKNKLDYIAVRNRLHQSKMTFEDAIDMSKGTIRKKYTLNGKPISIREECHKRGLSYLMVIARIRRGISVKDALSIKKYHRK